MLTCLLTGPVRLFGPLLFAASFAAACSSPTTPPPAPGIHILSPSAAADTIEAEVATALVVELRDSTGQAQAGARLHFQAGTVLQEGIHHPSVFVRAVGTSGYGTSVAVETDGQGRAAVQVRLGRVAGPAHLKVSSATFGYEAEASFTVLPGAPAQVHTAPTDTAIYVGSGYGLRMSVRDRRGNPVPGVTPTVSAESGTVSISGTTVNGQAVGRAALTVSAGGHAEHVHVSVVPRGTLLATAHDGVYTFSLDGSGFRQVVARTGARSPRWMADGEEFVYTVGLGHAYVADLDGTRGRLIPESPLVAEIWAHPSRDGAWVYFGGYNDDFRGYPYRVRPNGTDLQLIPGFTPDGFTQGHPSPSPDGNRIAFFREQSHSRNVVIRRLDMTTGERIGPDVEGHSPAWSHGDSIAYLDTRGSSVGPMMLMAADGTGQRTLSTASYDFGFDWSPDDAWIVGRNVELNRLELIEVSTGLRLPLPFTSGLFNPAWRP